MINIINKAITNKEILSIQYVDKKGNRSNRMVEPYELKGGKLFAYCLEKGSIRAFITTSLSNVTQTGEIFTPRF